MTLAALAALAALVAVAGTELAVLASGAPHADLTSEQQLPPLFSQGVARVPDGWIVSGTNALARLDDRLQQTRIAFPAIPPAWTSRGFDHIGDVDVVGDYVYAPFEQPDYAKGVQATARYDANTLAFVDALELHQHENSFVSVDLKTMIAYSMDRFDGDALVRYDVAKHWKPLAPLRMSETVRRVQGADVADGAVWLSTDDATGGMYRVDLRSGHVEAIGSSGHVDGEGEGIDATRLPGSLLHVLTVDVALVPVWLDHFAVTAPQGTSTSRAASRAGTHSKARDSGSNPAVFLFGALGIAVLSVAGLIVAVKRSRRAGRA